MRGIIAVAVIPLVAANNLFLPYRDINPLTVPLTMAGNRVFLYNLPGLIIVLFALEIGFRVLAGRAHVGSLFPFVNVSAVAALALDFFLIFK